MAHYKAEVFLGPNSGYQTIEINASSINGVTEQIQMLYNIPPEYIRNVREVSSYTSSSENFEYGYGGLLALVFLVFLFFPAPTLMVLSGGIGAWVSTRMTKKTFSEILEPKHKKLYVIVMVVSILCGGFGYYIGDKIEKDASSIIK